MARKGHLFTGASGSGKSSLLDAIATVLTPTRVPALQRGRAGGLLPRRRPELRQLRPRRLEQGGGRDAGPGRQQLPASRCDLERRSCSASRAARATSSRSPGCSTSEAAASIRPTCTTWRSASRDDIDLDALRPFAEQGIEARGAKAAWPAAVITTNGSHKAYFARVQRLLGIEGDNALQLLHRTQSAKNLGSLDQLFRGFMLDEPVTFDRAEERRRSSSASCARPTASSSRPVSRSTRCAPSSRRSPRTRRHVRPRRTSSVSAGCSRCSSTTCGCG